MRHSATKSLLERRDVIVVASVSCIYGIGAPETYQGMHLALRDGEVIDRDAIIRRLIAQQYERNDYDFHRGTFRVRGDVVEVFPANEESTAIRIELFGDTIDGIHRLDPLKGQVQERLEDIHIYPKLSRRLHDELPSSTWIEVPGGHACLWEYPDEFNRAVLGFLGDVAG